MPTTIANPRVTFNHVSGRWSGFNDEETSAAGRGQTILFGVVIAAGIVICALCFASGFQPVPVNSTEFAALLSP